MKYWFINGSKQQNTYLIRDFLGLEIIILIKIVVEVV